ncbi:MAG: hypothetical protein ACI9R3_005933, partial [Verrucomicrobiales bacterium]
LTVGSVIASDQTFRAGQSVVPDVVISTSPRNNAELITPSEATFRLGRATSASVSKGKAQLIRGSVLVSSAGRILGRRSEQLSTDTADVACNGSVLVAADGASVKVTCLEGSAVVRLAKRRSQFLQLSAGSMVMLDNSSSELPVPVEIDLQRLTRTAGLLGKPFSELNAEKGIRRAIARQQRALAKGKLLASSVTVSGSGGETSVGDSPSGGSQSDSSSSSGGSSSSSSGGSSSGGGGGGSGGGAVASTGGGSLSSAACA